MRSRADESPLRYDDGLSSHTWLQIEPCDADERKLVIVANDDIYSFGPSEFITSPWLMISGVKSTYWNISDYYDFHCYKVVKKCWELDKVQCETLRMAFAEGYLNNFSIRHYCTTEAIDILRKQGIEVPDGKGMIDFCEYLPNVRRANPKDFANQLIGVGGVVLTEKASATKHAGKKKGK